MKHIIFIIVITIPLIVLGATSTNYQLDQEGTGFTEFDSNSANYEFKTIIGDAGSEVSTSTNYTIDQRRIWSVVVSIENENENENENEDEDEDEDEDEEERDRGGGGNGGGDYFPPQTGASFSGRAYPLSYIELLKDGQIIATTLAGPDASFYIAVTGINAGTHMFSIIGRDTNGLRSQSFSFPITLSSGVTTHIGGLFLAPTLSVDKKVVERGDNLSIFGQTVPESEVTVGVASIDESFHKVDSDKNGVFLYILDTAPLEDGDHETRAKAKKGSEISEFSRTVAFEVGDRTILNTDIGCPEKGDLNDDCRVNLIDFSIVGFWYKKDLSESMLIRERAQLNGDGVIDLVDLSIMGFYWTG